MDSGKVIDHTNVRRTNPQRKTARQARWRARQRVETIIAPTPIGLGGIELLIRLRWLDRRNSEDRHAIGEALGAMLGEAALFLPQE